MPDVQYVYVQRTRTESGDTGTVTYDLPEKGFCPEIVVTAYSTPTASTNPAQPITDFLTRVEIVDGSRVLVSLTGKQVKALSFYHGNKHQILTDRADNAVASREAFRLHLGVKANGRHYAPDLGRFSNPQIRLSWDASLTTTQSGVPVDADTAPATQFTVMCKVVRNTNKYTHGYKKSYVLRTFTSAASTTEQTEIPRGLKLLGIGIEAGYNGFRFDDDINQIKLDFDNGAWVPLDLRAAEVLDIQEEFFSEPFTVAFSRDVRDGRAIDLNMGFQKGLSILGNGTDADNTYANLSDDFGVVTLAVNVSVGNADTTYRQTHFSVQGFLPFHMWYCPMSKLNGDESDTVDTTNYGRIILETVSAAALSTSSTPDVIVEYLVDNPDRQA